MKVTIEYKAPLVKNSYWEQCQALPAPLIPPFRIQAICLNNWSLNHVPSLSPWHRGDSSSTDQWPNTYMAWLKRKKKKTANRFEVRVRKEISGWWLRAGTERPYRVTAEVILCDRHHEAKTKGKPASREREGYMGGRGRASERRESLLPGVTFSPSHSWDLVLLFLVFEGICELLNQLCSCTRSLRKVSNHVIRKIDVKDDTRNIVHRTIKPQSPSK